MEYIIIGVAIAFIIYKASDYSDKSGKDNGKPSNKDPFNREK